MTGGNKINDIEEVKGELVNDEFTTPMQKAIPLENNQQVETIPLEIDSLSSLKSTSISQKNDLSSEEETSKNEEKESLDKEKIQEQKAEEQIKRIEKALQDQAQEGEKPQSSSFTIGKILGGDILSAQVLRNNIGVILLIVIFNIIYITNRYTAQRYLIEIDKLNTELEDAKYRALSSSSQLTEKTRESHILELLKNRKDSVIKVSDRPPYIINVPE